MKAILNASFAKNNSMMLMRVRRISLRKTCLKRTKIMISQWQLRIRKKNSSK
jgi:hypothetical protein